MRTDDQTTYSRLNHQKIDLIVHKTIGRENIEGNSSYAQGLHSELQGLQEQTRKKSDFQSFQYSMKDNQSLHSYFSQGQMLDFLSDQNQSMNVQQPQSLKVQLVNFMKKGKESDEQYDIQNYRQQIFTNFSKHNQSEDLFQAQILNNSIKQMNKQKQPSGKQNRKTYTSYLCQAVEKNHLQSLNKQKRMANQREYMQNTYKKPVDGYKQAVDGYKQAGEEQMPNHQQARIYNKPEPSKQRAQTPPKAQSHLGLNQYPTRDQPFPPSQPPESPSDSPKEFPRIQPRMIPSDLFSSYDQLNLSISKHHKARTDNLPIRLKDRAGNARQQQRNRQHVGGDSRVFDQELFAALPILEGYCDLRYGQDERQTKFVLIKNDIVFQAYRRLAIDDVTKVKFIQNNGRITLKITHSLVPGQKPQVFIVNIRPSSEQTYFSQSYNLFAHIILRKLILMNLTINEVNQRNYSPPTRPSMSSPPSSPINLPGSLELKLVEASQLLAQQNRDICKCQLYKKSLFFNSWQKKYFTISPEKGLRCFPSSNQLKKTSSQSQKASSQLQKTSQIWTRFQLIYGYVNIKMWQNKIQKIQIGIPLCDFTNVEGQQNWLFSLCKYIVWRNNMQDVNVD